MVSRRNILTPTSLFAVAGNPSGKRELYRFQYKGNKQVKLELCLNGLGWIAYSEIFWPGNMEVVAFCLVCLAPETDLICADLSGELA